jgi:hypothetical protein
VEYGDKRTWGVLLTPQTAIAIKYYPGFSV